MQPESDNSAEKISGSNTARRSSVKTSVVLVTSSGLQYQGTRTTSGTIGSSDLAASNGLEVTLSARELQEATNRVTLEDISTRASIVGSAVSDGTLDKLQPRLKNALTTPVGRDPQGRLISLQQSRGQLRSNSVTATILMVDGDATAIVRNRAYVTGADVEAVSSIVTVLDSTGRAVVVEDIHSTFSQQVGSWNRAKSAFDFAGGALLSLVQPDALHAATLDEFEEWPCTSEMIAATIAAGAASAAEAASLLAEASERTTSATVIAETAAFAAAMAACPETGVTCAAAAAVAIQLAAADAA